MYDSRSSARRELAVSLGGRQATCTPTSSQAARCPQTGSWPSGSAGPMGDWPTLLSDKAGTAGWEARAGDPWAWSSGPGLARGQAGPASQPCALNPSVPPGMRCAAGGA